MTDRRAAGRLLAIGAGLLVLGMTACASSSAADAPTASVSEPPPVSVADETTTLAPGLPTTSMLEAMVATPTTAPTSAPVDGTALLATALGTLSTSYHFTTAIVVDGSVAVLADGDRVGDGVRLALTANAGTVNYIITADGSWVMPQGGEWEQLDSAAATSDPIAALSAPSSVTVSSSDGATATLAVSVAAAALGLAAGADVTITCELADGLLRRLVFESSLDGRPATVTAEFGTVVDGSPVVAPI